MKRHLLVLLVLLCGPLHGQEAEPEEDRAALDEARQRLDTLGEPATDEDREWKEALSDRIRLLEELLRTRATQAALPARELVEERGTAAEAELEALRASEPPESISLATADELAAYEQASLVAEA